MNNFISNRQFKRIVEMYGNISALYDEALSVMLQTPDNFDKQEFEFIESVYQFNDKLFHICSEPYKDILTNKVIKALHDSIVICARNRDTYDKGSFMYRTMNSLYDAMEEGFENIINEI